MRLMSSKFVPSLPSFLSCVFSLLLLKLYDIQKPLFWWTTMTYSFSILTVFVTEIIRRNKRRILLLYIHKNYAGQKTEEGKIKQHFVTDGEVHHKFGRIGCPEPWQFNFVPNQNWNKRLECLWTISIVRFFSYGSRRFGDWLCLHPQVDVAE
jgi:hypothetical protein